MVMAFIGRSPHMLTGIFYIYVLRPEYMYHGIRFQMKWTLESHFHARWNASWRPSSNQGSIPIRLGLRRIYSMSRG